MKNTVDEMIRILQAYKDGEVIQFRLPNGKWRDINNIPCWSFNTDYYRVKPDPVFDGKRGDCYRCKNSGSIYLLSYIDGYGLININSGQLFSRISANNNTEIFGIWKYKWWKYFEKVDIKIEEV